MGKIRDLKGQKFERLLVVEFSHKSKKERGAAYWKCLCDCGNSRVIRGTSLLKGNSRSCGCLRNEKAAQYLIIQNEKRKLPFEEASKNMLYKSYKRLATRRGIEFHLDMKQFLELTKSDCHYCGREPSQIQGDRKLNGNYVYNGIDRSDNKLGYKVGNCVPCCKYCNVAKMQMSEDEFLNLVKRIYDHRKLQLLGVQGGVPGDPA